MSYLSSKRHNPERRRVHTVGDLLNFYLPPVVRPYIRKTLQDYLDKTRGPDGFLIDSRGEKLRFDPDNEPTPPDSCGIQLSFKSLPQHDTQANTPVVINSVDEMAMLYCREFVKKKAITIETADSSSLLNILARASCFPPGVRQSAGRARDDVRNLWAHGIYEVWSAETFNESLDILLDLVVKLPGHRELAARITCIKK